MEKKEDVEEKELEYVDVEEEEEEKEVRKLSSFVVGATGSRLVVPDKKSNKPKALETNPMDEMD